jgi:hypothetical protein
MTAETRLPIRRLTLYKHGVGFVERRGNVGGEEVQLVFRADEVNDALKSLLVLEMGGGQVRGIHYQTPADQDARLAESPIKLSADHSLLDLLRSLRGWAVRLVLGTGTQGQDVRGRLVGVEVPDEKPNKEALVTLLDEESQGVLVLPLREVRQVFLLEDRAEQDLDYFLDISRSEEMHRTVTVRLEAGEHDLAVSYLVPSPTWRVSYRLVAEAEKGETPPADGAAPAPKQGKLLLQGWGLFDNRLEEDLEDVQVTLVAGQPISFIYDLAASRIPERPVVEDAARVAAAPVEFEGAIDSAPAAMAFGGAPGAPPMAMRAFAAPAPAMAEAMPPPPSIAAMSKQQTAATGSDLGELFQYEVVAPVTVKRGASALVPILNAQMPYRRELLFNQQKMPEHPVAALRFNNESGLVLERGPVTILEDGEYHGEALVPFTKTGGEVYLAFSVELGIKVTQTSDTRVETAGIRINGAIIVLKQATITTTTYRIENNLGTPQLITVEHPIWNGYDLVDTPAPDAQTSDFYRWVVPCSPRKATTFKIAQRYYNWERQQLLDQSYDTLRQFLKNRWLDQPTLDRIRSLMEERARIAKNNQEVGDLERERQQIYDRQEQLRKNMTTLSTTGDEAVLRKKVFDQLQATEDRLAAIDARIAALKDENKQRETTIDQELKKLGNIDSDAPAKPER